MVVISNYSDVAPAALNIQRQTGVPASIILAVMTNEGGIGANQSSLSKLYNNFFGIKSASDPPGSSGSVSLPTWEVVGGRTVNITDGFAIFPDVQSGLSAFVNFLKANSRYRNLVNANGEAVTTDPNNFARLLQQDGYGTDPQLANKYASLASSAAIQNALAAAGDGSTGDTSPSSGPPSQVDPGLAGGAALVSAAGGDGASSSTSSSSGGSQFTLVPGVQLPGGGTWPGIKISTGFLWSAGFFLLAGLLIIAGLILAFRRQIESTAASAARGMAGAAA